MKMIQATISTKYFDEEIAFYERFLGITIQRDIRPLGREIVFLGDPDAQTFVEIIHVPDAETAGGDNLSIGFRVPDIHTLREGLQKAGFDPTPFISPQPGVQFFYVKDPAGVTVQFI